MQLLSQYYTETVLKIIIVHHLQNTAKYFFETYKLQKEAGIKKYVFKNKCSEIEHDNDSTEYILFQEYFSKLKGKLKKKRNWLRYKLCEDV